MKSFLVAILVASGLYAQTASVVGAVIKVDSGNLTLKPDNGPEVNIAIQPNATFRRVAPGETNLQNASAIAVADIHPGDRVLARGTTTGTATLIVVMSQNDLAKKQAADRADWDKRGVMGNVTAVTADSLTLSSRSGTGTTQVVVTLGANTAIRRYAPDSVKFADARPAKISDIKIGDQVRARGERTDDKLVAEEIVAGTFRTIAAVIGSVSASTSELQVTDLDSKKKLTLKLTADSTLRKLTPQNAQMIATRVRPDLAAKSKGGQNVDVSQIVDRSPTIAIGDLKSGDALVVSSTVGASADKLTAISVLAGVEPVLTKPGTQEMSLGSWSIDLGGVSP